jgi:hypothetical protein
MTIDEFGRDTTHARPWAEVETLADIAELTAQWLEGRINFHPTNLGPSPDPETTELVPVLAALNRAGYCTDFSQPGEPVVDGCGQRAAVVGYCDEDIAGRLIDLSARSELVVLAYWPERRGRFKSRSRWTTASRSHGSAQFPSRRKSSMTRRTAVPPQRPLRSSRHGR